MFFIFFIKKEKKMCGQKNEIGKIILKGLKLKGMSQRDLAEKLGVKK